MSLIRRLILYTLGTRCIRAASARDAMGRPRTSGRSTRSVRRYGGNTKREGRACRVRWGGRTPTGCGRDKYETGGTRLSRPMGERTPTGCGRDKRGPPVCLTYMTIRSFPVPFPSDHFPYSPVGEAARKPTSKPISVSPSLRALRVDRPEATRCTRAASARDAMGRLRASGRSTRSARGHGGNTKREGRACRVRWGDGRRRGADSTNTKREGRACRVRWGGRTPTGCGRDKRGPPVCLTCMIIRSFPVPFPSDHFPSLSSG